MAAVTAYGSRIMTGLTSTPVTLADPGEGGGKVRVWVETVETTATDLASSTYLLARLPSNARILGQSMAYWDDLASAACTGTLGIYNVSGSAITDVASALSQTALDLASANTGSRIIQNIDSYGLPLWDLNSLVSSDPKVQLDIKLKLANDLTAAGTFTVEIYYTVD
jgi:hypothetical protein